MLVLSRKLGDSIVINNNIVVTVIEICGNRIRLGFDAPNEVKILRSELAQISRPESAIKLTGQIDWSSTVSNHALFDGQ